MYGDRSAPPVEKNRALESCAFDEVQCLLFSTSFFFFCLRLGKVKGSNSCTSELTLLGELQEVYNTPYYFI